MKKLLRSAFLLLGGIFASLPAFSQTNSVELKNTTGTVISSHNSIGSAYGAIPATISQAYVIEITSTYTGANETFPITFGVKTGASASNTITLRPASGVTGVTISANSAGNAILALDDADFIRIDGRPGGTGTTKALTFTNTATGSNANTINLINGATNNIIRYCTINNSTTGSAGRGLFFGTSATNTTGNSDNVVEFTTLNSGRYIINSNGTPANPNTRNKIYGCDMVNVVFVGFWGQSGTGKLAIDSCRIFNTSPVGDGPSAILFDSQTDTVTISRNRIFDIDNGTRTSAVRGINVRSVTGTNLTRIHNNFIALSSANASGTSVIGIEYAGSAATNAEIYFNSIRISGTLGTGGTSGNVGSAAFSKTATSTASVFNIRNNLFVNNRTGGNAGLQHLAMSLANTSGTITSDYNTYNSTSGNLVRLGATVYTTIAAYQAAAPAGTEANSNDAAVQFVSTTDLHLAPASASNPALHGIQIPGITIDIDNETRSVPFRGADEAGINCSGTPNPGAVTANPAIVCAGGSTTLSLPSVGNVLDLTFQWQSSPNGTTWTNVTGGTNRTLTVSPTAATHYRAIVTCPTSSQSATSSPLQVTITPAPSVTGITATSTANTFTFTATGVQNATSYAWSFGNGATSTAVSPSVTYATSGTYNVQLIVSNACGSDTANFTVNLSGCFGKPTAGTTVASAPTICAGASTTLTLSGMVAADVPFLSFQWQQSTSGTSTSWTNVAGATNDTLVASPTVSTFYRAIVTCAGSSQSDTSSLLRVQVNPLPRVTGITTTRNGNTYTFTATGIQSVTTYAWSFGDGRTSNAPSPTNTYTTPGTYTVRLVVTNSCGTDSAQLTINVVTGLSADRHSASINLFPNPANDVFTLEAEGLKQPEAAVRITDLTGKLIWSNTYSMSADSKLHLSARQIGLSAGVYLVELRSGEQQVIRKLIVQ